MKATSIFGGVQVIQIIIGIIRSKFIAVLLGPTGMGISGLLQASIGMIAGITNFGLSTSAIKNISAAFSEANEEKAERVIAVFRKLIWITGLIGAFITLISSSYLSRITFGNESFSWAFAMLSVTLLINQISSGQSALLQATRQIKILAKSSVLGSVFGLLTTVPLYYLYGIDGIVPATIITAVTTWFIVWHYSNKLPYKKIKVNFSDIKFEGKKILLTGFMIGLSGIMALSVSYFVRIFISNYSSVEQVGLYNAGFAIINSYVGMIFIAMGTDYYPRLSALSNNTQRVNECINKQAEIAILIMGPIIMTFIVFIKWIVILLYSEAFLPVNSMILFAAAGMPFKALSWAIAFIFLAKGSSKLFFWNELAVNIYSLGLNLAGFYVFGLTGLGISFLIAYAVYALQVYLISKKYFKYSINKDLLIIFIVNVVLIFNCVLLVLTFDSVYIYGIGVLLVIISILYNVSNLNNRIALKFFTHSNKAI